MSPADPQKLYVDAHVHLYHGGDVETLLEAAARNIAAAAGDPATPGLLILTENEGLDRFQTLDGRHGAWTVTATQEPVSRLARSGTRQLAIIRGRQIVTAEGIEIHAFGTPVSVPDGTAAADVLRIYRGVNAPCVLPWGVGKWSGARGRLIDTLIAEVSQWPGLMLADSGVRPTFWPRPRRLAAGEAAGLKVLAGSDPLPLAAETCKAGRYGVVLDGPFDPDRPYSCLTAALALRSTSPPTFGNLENPAAFLQRQVAMQLRKFR